MAAAHHPPTQGVYGASWVWSWTKLEVMDDMFSTWVEKHNGLLEVLFTLMSGQSWEWVTFQVGGLRNNKFSSDQSFSYLDDKEKQISEVWDVNCEAFTWLFLVSGTSRAFGGPQISHGVDFTKAGKRLPLFPVVLPLT